MTRRTRPLSGWLPPVVADLLGALLFAIGGKSTHEASSSGWVVLAIVWPFALSVVVAHAGVLMRGLRARRVWPEGVAVLSVTYVVGMVLRALSGRGIDGAFLVVAVLFLAATMLGWRVILSYAHPRLRRRFRRDPDRTPG